VTTTNQSHSHENASIRAILYAFVANLGIALIKSWAALYTGSGSMLAEAIHSFADSGNQVLLFIGLKQAQKPADTEHPLGYGKISYFYSFIVALMLFSIGGLFSIYEGIHKFQNPEPLNQLWVAAGDRPLHAFVDVLCRLSDAHLSGRELPELVLDHCDHRLA
jgi:divalent metal cation (Fe/Co/Zn/Cd) transporter